MSELEHISLHTWLWVRVGGEVRDVCCGCWSNTPGSVHFTVLSEVKLLTPWLRPFSHLGSVIENIRRDRQARRQHEKEVSDGDHRFHTSRISCA